MRLPWLSEDSDSPTHQFTRSGWRIPQLNVWDLYKDPRRESLDLIKIRTEALVSEMKTNQKQSPEIRSLSKSLYNCVGMIFCSRKAHVDIEHVYDILRYDGYTQIAKEQLVAGDLVLYTFAREPSHIGLVSCISMYDLRVLSKWGKAGEVEHDYREVPAHCGIPTAYYSTRANHVAE